MKPLEVKINVTDHISKEALDRFREAIEHQKPVHVLPEQLESLGIAAAYLSKPPYSIERELTDEERFLQAAELFKAQMQALAERISEAVAAIPLNLNTPEDKRQKARERSRRDVQSKRRDLFKNKRNYTPRR